MKLAEEEINGINFAPFEYDLSDISDLSSPAESVVSDQAGGADDDENKPKRKKETQKRRRLTPDETRILCRVFDHNPKPNSTLRNQLAQQLNMTARNIQIWFQNRRAKLKRDGSVDDMVPQMFQNFMQPHIAFAQKDNGVPILPAGFKLPPAYGVSAVLRTNSIGAVPMKPMYDSQLIQALKFQQQQQQQQQPQPRTFNPLTSQHQLPVFDISFADDLPFAGQEQWNSMNLAGVPTPNPLKSSSDLGSMETIPPLSRKKSFDDIDDDDDIVIEMIEHKRRKSVPEIASVPRVDVSNDFQSAAMGYEGNSLFEF